MREPYSSECEWRKDAANQRRCYKTSRKAPDARVMWTEFIFVAFHVITRLENFYILPVKLYLSIVTPSRAVIGRTSRHNDKILRWISVGLIGSWALFGVTYEKGTEPSLLWCHGLFASILSLRGLLPSIIPVFFFFFRVDNNNPW